MAKQVNNCGNCVFWGGKGAALPKGYGVCGKANQNPASQSVKPKMYAPVGLLTQKEFNCNQHVIKK